MPRIPENLCPFIPMSGDRDNCACYVLYDWHPRDDSKIDITICSRTGHVQEFYKRNLILSFKIDSANNFKQIRIIRNRKAELFYIVGTDNEVIILRRKQKLVIQERISNVRLYEVLDEDCTGEAKIKIVLNDITMSDGKTSHDSYSMICLSSENNFKNGKERDNEYNSLEDHKPAIYELQTKLNESKYNLSFNENALKNVVRLRQLAGYCNHETEAVTKQILKPTVVICNKNIVLSIKLFNPHTERIEKVCAFIHNNGCNSISYTTKLFEILLRSPFYMEKETQEIKGGETAIIAVVIPIKEFNSSLNSSIEFNLAVSYQRFVAGEPLGKQVKEYLHPCHNMEISACELMGKQLDIYDKDLNSRDGRLTKCSILAMLAATDKTTLCIEHFHENVEPRLLRIMFSKYLNMEVIEYDKIGYLKCPPHHMLYGLMIIFPNYDGNDNFLKIDVYARFSLQVLALTHFIYDSVPLKVVVTTPSVLVKYKTINTLSQEYNETTNNDTSHSDYTICDSSVIEQASMTLQYFDECQKTMNTNPDLKSRLDNEIDIFAMGFDKFTEYQNKMLTEAKNCIEIACTKTETEYPPDSQNSDCVMISLTYPY